jgi:hypothetical protein
VLEQPALQVPQLIQPLLPKKARWDWGGNWGKSARKPNKNVVPQLWGLWQ